MKAKHTPGPWTTFSYPDHVAVVFRPEHPRRSGTVCDLTGIGGEHDANARLIAAAPDLLDALESVNTMLNCVSQKSKEAPNGNCDCYMCEAARLVKTAIAKAKGQ